MAKLGGSWDDYSSGKVHKEKVVKKYERIQGLQGLLKTWEEHDNTAETHAYVLQLRAKLRCAQNQFEAMRGDLYA